MHLWQDTVHTYEETRTSIEIQKCNFPAFVFAERNTHQLQQEETANDLPEVVFV